MRRVYLLTQNDNFSGLVLGFKMSFSLERWRCSPEVQGDISSQKLCALIGFIFNVDMQRLV